MKKNIFGFSFNPCESEHHFLILIPKSKNSYIVAYERFNWQHNSLEQKISENDILKVQITIDKWKLIKDVVKNEFNIRLKNEKLPTYNWCIGQNVLHRLFGKELILLMWAIEDCDLTEVDNAIKNWQGLSKEERWWLFTMTNAATGSINDKYGWRKAIKYALIENPINFEKRQLTFEELLS